MQKGNLTKQAIIERIIEKVHVHGFSQTSLNDIIALTGVKKGNLYFHFQSKEELILQAIKEAHRQYQEYLTQCTSKVPGPLEKIEAMLDAVVAYHTRRKFKGGCIFGNTALEMSDKSRIFQRLIQTVFLGWIDWIAKHLDQAVKEGALSEKTPVKELSHHIIAALEGGIMLSKVTKKPDELEHTVRIVRELLHCYSSKTLKKGTAP